MYDSFKSRAQNQFWTNSIHCMPIRPVSEFSFSILSCAVVSKWPLYLTVCVVITKCLKNMYLIGIIFKSYPRMFCVPTLMQAFECDENLAYVDFFESASSTCCTFHQFLQSAYIQHLWDYPIQNHFLQIFIPDSWWLCEGTWRTLDVGNSFVFAHHN
jgi:hypothetical protein